MTYRPCAIVPVYDNPRQHMMVAIDANHPMTRLVDPPEYTRIFKDAGFAFRLSFLNKCDEVERSTIAEYYQRCFGSELDEGAITCGTA